jgi:peptidoglycan/xylan/chitin deacetylase (PgdA/CDA1 family)
MNKKFITIILSAFLMTSCANTEQVTKNNIEAVKTTQAATSSAENPAEAPKTVDSKATIDLKLKPNEAGKIMVLMYHNIGNEEKEWIRTPANFLKDMNTLYEKGYRPISLSDYVKGNITTEQGFTPIVITFDDGNKNNFEYLDDGTTNKVSAVNLLMDFNKSHKDFPLEATFFLTGSSPFNQKGSESEKINFIVDHGMDVGNHTQNHVNLKSTTGAEIQKEIGAQAQFLKSLIKSADYDINTFALPFGIRPKDKSLTLYLASGSFNDVAYENIAILNVGWNPAYSPYDTRFDHTSIPRIRASEMKVDNVGLYNYIDYFDKNPEERFISDGIVGVVTIPENKKEKIGNLNDKELYLYSTGK